jgi:hypothetical protein
MLKNRLVGINLQEEEYEYQGDVKTRLNVCQVLDAQKVRDGKVKVREKKLLDGKTAKPTSRAKTYDDESDIPFD